MLLAIEPVLLTVLVVLVIIVGVLRVIYLLRRA